MINKIKLYIFSFALLMFFGLVSNCSAAYSEANLEASELDASTTAQIENFYNKLEDGKLGEDISGIKDANNVENSFNFEDYFDYNKIHFWILLVSVVLIFLILINLFQRLGEMRTQMDEYRKKVFTNTSNKNYQEDETGPIYEKEGQALSEEENLEEDEEIEDDDNYEKEELLEDSVHPHLHIDVESDDEDVDDATEELEEEEDIIIDEDEDQEEEIVLEKKSKDSKKKIEIEEENIKELKELELEEDDEDEEILYN